MAAIGHHQPARDDGACGTARRASRSTTRSSGRTRAPAALVRELAGDGGRRTGCATRVGLPLSTYFSGPKITWLLDNVAGRARARRERASWPSARSTRWLLWNLTGGADGGVHATDVTNASRTMLMDLRDARLARAEPRADGHPARAAARDPLLAARSTARPRGTALGGVPVAGILGDQQAALFGQTLLRPRGGQEHLRHRLVPARQHRRARSCARRRAADERRGYRLGDGRPSYVLEGSIAVTGALVQWLRDRLGLIVDAPPRSRSWRAASQDNGGVYFVPAFSGLFAPRWREDARGVIVGPDRLRAPRATSRGRRSRRPRGRRREVRRRGQRGRRSVRFSELRVDGGMTANELLMQFQADVLGVPVMRPAVDRDDRARRRLRGRPGGRLLVGPGRAARALARGAPLGAAAWTRASASASTRAGAGRRALARLGRRAGR